MAVEYKLFDVVRTGVNLMAARTPRVQKDVPRDFGDHLSWMVNNDMWNIDPTNGEPLSYEGKTLEQVLEEWLAPRPHCLAAVELVDTSGECWTSGNITLQGQRLKELESFTGSAKAGMVMLQEEAASFGVKPFTTEKSDGKIDPTRPHVAGEAAKKSGGKGSGRDNPWDRTNFVGSEEYRAERMESILKGPSEIARGMCRAANVDLAGRPLRPGKSY